MRKQRYKPDSTKLLRKRTQYVSKDSPHDRRNYCINNQLMGTELLPQFVQDHYEVHESKHACAILKQDFPHEWVDICDVLTEFRLRKSWITIGGGSKSQVSGWIDKFLEGRGWIEKQFDTEIVVDEHRIQSPTHKVDCFKNRVALEIEWNNKDPFFDRDLNNFRLLFELRAVSVGVIITRADAL
jgi:hypothetical protein